MADSTMMHWQQWESRVQEWLNRFGDELLLVYTTPSDRRILVVLTVKYQLSYVDMDKDEHSEKQKRLMLSTIKLMKMKPMDRAEKKEDSSRDMGPRCQLFYDLTGHYLKPAQAVKDTSSQWKDFSHLCDWHGLEFLQRFDSCLRQLIAQCVGHTSAYQELISKPVLVSPVDRIIPNEIYLAKNEDQVYLTIDIESANFSLLKKIGAIDAQTYSTWSDFLFIFVGSRPSLLQSKTFRMRSLVLLPQVYKLEALMTHFMASIYQDIVYPHLMERNIKAKCVGLEGDEIVFHLKSTSEREVMNLVHKVQQQLNEIPIVPFVVQAYRLRLFHWKNQHTCFARVFLGKSEQTFDLKCVPNKYQNYDQAYADYQSIFAS